MKMFRKNKGLVLLSLFFFIVVVKLIVSYRRYQPTIYVPKPADPTRKYCHIPIYKDFIRHSEDTVLLSDLKCPKFPDLVTIRAGKVRITSNFVCTSQCIDWSTDFSYSLNEKTPLSDLQNVPCQYFLANCQHSQTGKSIDQLVLTGVRNESLVQHAKTLINGSKRLRDVLILGVDSMSYNAFKHYLPKTFAVLHNQLNGVSFTKFNTMGDGTTVNLQALLTGTKDTETYESRRRISGAKMVDDYNWIWNHYKRRGYLTQYYEEMTDYGTFQYRLLGFEKQPTDIYLRTFLMYAERNKVSKNFCLGNKPQHLELLRFYKEVKEKNPEVPTFSFLYFSLTSHDDNKYTSYMDEDFARFLIETRKGNPDMLIVLYADHGHRFNSRLSMQGKYEERLPFLGISLPKDLQHKKLILEENSKILMTGLDVHATLEDILGMYKSRIRSRHMSLLRPLPVDRSCFDIESAAHWCACLNWIEISNPNLDVRLQKIAHFISRQIANFTLLERDLCAELEIDKIVTIHKMEANEEVLKFKQSADVDGFVPDLSDSMKHSHTWFRVVLKTTPGDAVFEVTVSVKASDFDNNRQNIPIESISSEDVSRINRFAPWIKCLTNISDRKSTVSDIRKFCICKNAL